MKSCIRFSKSMLILGIIIPTFFSFTQDFRGHADELFHESRYYDAFFLYREIYGNVVSQNEAALRCSHAMALTKQYKDYKSIGKITEAKLKLEDLIAINPYDFHKPELTQMTHDEANTLQKMAFRQETVQETNNMLDKAISLYQQTQNLGWKGGDVDVAIQQCLASKTESLIYEKAIQENVKPLQTKMPQATRKPSLVIIIPKEN
jgi:hypothetical protein